MWRAVLVIMGWVTALLSLYLAVLALELYWNFFDWSPHFDAKALGSVLAALIALAGLWGLTRVSSNRATLVFSLLGCLALLSLGGYCLPKESKKPGLFERKLSSPLWYRGARLLVLSCPTLLWATAFSRPTACPPTSGAGGRRAVEGQ